MTVKAKLKYLRIAPRKVRLVADMIRGQKVGRAKSYLKFTVNRSSEPVLKLLNSAVSNAKNKMEWEESNLYISSITVDEGPKLKRWRPRARGSASPIHKKTSHITVTLEQLEKKDKKETKKKKGKKIETKKVSSLSEIKEDFSKENNKKPEKEKTDKVKSTEGKQAKSKMFRRKSI